MQHDVSLPSLGYYNAFRMDQERNGKTAGVVGRRTTKAREMDAQKSARRDGSEHVHNEFRVKIVENQHLKLQGTPTSRPLHPHLHGYTYTGRCPS